MILNRWLLSAALGMLLALGGLARAEEGAEPPAPPAEKVKDADKAKLRDILRKQKAGEELTADEKALLEKARPRLGKEGKAGNDPAAPGREGRPGAEPGKPMPPPVEGLDVVNATDAVKLALAQGYLGKNELDKAAEVLEKLAKATQDKTAAGYAHLALARIYQQKNEPAKRDEELKKVTGPAVAGALMMLMGAGGESAPKLEEFLKSAEDPLAKAIILRRLAMLYVQNGNLEKLADLAERSAKILPYKEALAAQEAEDKLQQRMAGRAGGPGGMRPGGPGGPGEGGPGMEMIRGRMEARIKELEAAGKVDEANRLREQLDKMGKGGRGPRGENVEALQKEIKELEAAGMVEEAAALKKQLKTLEERPQGRKLGPGREGARPMPGEGEDVF